MLRVDVANVYGSAPPREPFSRVIDDAIGHAVRLDAACVCVNLFDIPGADGLRRECIDNITRLRTAADRAGMPLMVEPLVMAPGQGGYGVDGDADRIVALVRQAAELGADVIKADPTDDLAAYHRVVTAARVPVLVRGGGRVSDEEILERTRAVLDQGARGIVYGRNVIQHPDPAAMVGKLRAVVHGDSERVTAQPVRVGIVGAGLMGRELAAAIGRWSALQDHPVHPELVAVCDTSPEALRWFDRDHQRHPQDDRLPPPAR